MTVLPPRLFVLTGGPGSGKSTLLAALAERGFQVAPEAGRAIILQQQRIDGPALPWRDRAAFAAAMLAFDMRTYDELARDDPAGRADAVFFDRGVPDVAGYLALCGLPVPDHVKRACALHRYQPRVFLAPPWADIYANDAERRQDWDEAVRTHAAMVRIYSELGYQMVDLPRAGVAERVAFVLDHIRTDP